MNPSDVLLAVPTRGAIQWGVVTRLQEIRDENPGLSPILYQSGGVSVALTRNKIVRRFLAGDWQTLVMVDDDVVPPNGFLELADHLDEFGMLAVPQPMPHPARPEAIMLSLYDKHGDRGYFFHEELEPGPVEVDAVGAGCVLISRDVFDAVGAAPFRVDNDPEALIAGEDFLFCEDLRASGFKVGYAFVDENFCDHHTTVTLAPLFKQNLAGQNFKAPESSVILPSSMNREQRRQLARMR